MNEHDSDASQETKNLIHAYQHFNDRGLVLPREPILAPNARKGTRRVSMNEILGRAAWDWTFSWLPALGVLTHTSGGSLDRYLEQALLSGQVENIGQLVEHQRNLVGIHDELLYGRKVVGGGYEGPQTRNGLDRMDQDGVAPGALVTTCGLLVWPHDLFITMAAAWIVEGFYREDGTVVVAYSEDRLRKFLGWFSPKTLPDQRPQGPSYCTYVPDGLLLFEGLSARLEFQRTQKSATDYAMTCAACYGEPVIYVARTEAIYRTLLRARWGMDLKQEAAAVKCELVGTGKPEVKNLFAVRLWNETDLKKLLVDLRKYAVELPYASHCLAKHYSQPKFIYQTISLAKAKIFLRQTELSQNGLSIAYRAATTEQKKEIDHELRENAHKAFVHIQAKTEAKRKALEEAAFNAKEKEVLARIQRDLDERAGHVWGEEVDE